jgi:hypothetical protein
MQLFLQDKGTVVLDTCEQTTIAELKAAYAARRAYGNAAEQALVRLVSFTDMVYSAHGGAASTGSSSIP